VVCRDERRIWQNPKGGDVGHIIEFQTEQGPVLVEVTEPPPAGSETLAGRGEVADRAAQTFEDALGKVRPAIESALNQVRRWAGEADEIGLQFGITLSGKVGAFISVGAEANLVVSMKWQRHVGGAAPSSS
jgi:hypothetical protein